MDRVILIRHGESKLNAANREQPVFCGQLDTPLTNRGRQQARDVGALLAKRSELNITHAVSSSLQRATETLTEIVGILRPPSVVLPADPRLNERSLGEFEGRLAEEVFREHPEFRDDPEYCRFRNDFEQKAPGGENLTDVTARAWPALLQLVEQATGDLLVVSHCNTIRCLIGQAAGLDRETTPSLKVRHTVPLILHRTAENLFLLEGGLPLP